MIARTVLLAASIAFPLAALSDAGTPEWVGEARQKSAQLGSRLVSTLREALASRGPMGGVEVCKIRAPEIAAQVSGDRFDVGRTALRVRNPDNAPDAWEKSVLERFANSMSLGADSDDKQPVSEEWRVEMTDEGRVGRYMKAIPTGPQCVVCHGENVAPALAETIQRLYPDDQATGFAPGDLRGAFTVTVELPATD
ncbi:MAG TPA: DUF3365 domain-containing protein [Wenzhouxiangellaceae bacterium]|nr:DUF3365 domain-containing protein [Wenzhouxiangellaceae bacterium]